MKTNNRTTAATHTLAAVAVFLGLAAFATLSCERSVTTAPAPKVSKKRPAEKVYTARARIVTLPSKGHPTAELILYHEAINDFVNPSGRLGMNSMEMPLPPDKSISLGEFAVGDIVEFDLSVWYGPQLASIESYAVTRMKKLPSDTQLHFGAAAPTPGAKQP